MASIRPATLQDLESITAIYNEAIETTTATFDMQPKTIEQQQKWFEAHDDRHPIIVAEIDGQVVGWVSLTAWSDRPAYDETAESSFYVKQDFRGQGIGRQLKQSIIERAKKLGYYTLIARVADGSHASLALNNEFGFVHIGTMKEVGKKFGKRIDVHIFQKMLNED